MRLLLLNPTKLVGDSGGLAKVNAAFANAMLERGHEVATVHSDEREGDFFYAFADGVRIYNLNRRADGTLQKMPAYRKLLRELMRPFGHARAMEMNDRYYAGCFTSSLRSVIERERPDVIVAFQPLAAMLAITEVRTDVPVVSMSHGDPADYFINYPEAEWRALEHCAAAQVLLPGFEAALRERFPHLPVTVIGNVVPSYEKQAELLSDKARRKILFLGRLVKNHKQPQHLVEAFASLAGAYPDWDVELWGDDDRNHYRKELEARIADCGLQERIRLKGTTRDVESVLADGDVFVFPSRVEGFGLTLAEAMAAGLPVVCYRSCQASRLVEDGVSGLLAEDGVPSLAKCMEALMRDADLRDRMGRAARQAMRSYSADVIYAEWDKLLEKAVR
ncbi:glycosyltransferase family 4 protein [Selenomonas sp. TAMA-11512]|uniref:glycosyltransferase n=1 Tax=Selenomonas sp. TAMA-11512 TaxID=3095337 RepID=UPI003093A4F4|nr:glycosyltransferase family 4 protein [Selenomonas sp. TAMA-11512]